MTAWRSGKLLDVPERAPKDIIPLPYSMRSRWRNTTLVLGRPASAGQEDGDPGLSLPCRNSLRDECLHGVDLVGGEGFLPKKADEGMAVRLLSQIIAG
jgi:hypothetical protein